MAITTRAALPVCVCCDERLQDGSIGSGAKAALLRQALQEHRVALGQGPLLQAIGERTSGILVTFDADELECVLPHQLMTSDVFSFEVLCSFVRDEERQWATAAVQGLREPVQLPGEDRHDVGRLAQRLSDSIEPNIADADVALVTEG